MMALPAGGRMRMETVAVAALLLVPIASADWPMAGHDPEGSAFDPTDGPVWPDVALLVPIVGNGDEAQPLVVGERAFYVVEEVGFSSPVTTGRTDAIQTVDLRTGEVAEFARFPPDAHVDAMASDGMTLFVADGSNLTALDLASGTITWHVPTLGAAPGAGLPGANGDLGPAFCGRIVVRDGRLMAACGALFGGAREIFITARDPTTGQELWRKFIDEDGGSGALVRTADSATEDGALAIDGLTVIDGFAYLSYHSRSIVATSVCSSELMAVDLATRKSTLITSTVVVNAFLDVAFDGGGGLCFRLPAPILAGQRAWAIDDTELIILDVADPANLQERPYALGDGKAGNLAAPSAFDGRRVFIVYGETLLAFTPGRREPDWSMELGGGDRWGARGKTADAIVVAGTRLYGLTESGEILCLDASTGQELWRSQTSLGSIIAANGLLVGASNTELMVLGAAPFSSTVQARASDLYPALGQDVTLDLTELTVSPSGPATASTIDWGDGTIEGWTESMVHAHRYETAGDYLARATVRNDANQTASVATVIHAGREPPANWIGQQFSRDNQERTFFLLGLAITGVFGAMGVLRVRRRRDILAQELEAVESAVREARDDPARIDRALDERRFRARGLLLDHRLDEGQHAVLLARIEELSRSSRLDVVERSLDFLPYRHVRAVKEMLRDGRVSSLERAHFLALLDADATLVDEYKARVRAVVEQWADHDRGGGS